MRLITLCLSLSALFFMSFSYAKSTIQTEKSFTAVAKLIQHDKHPSKTLLVLDDDDTLTMMPCRDANHCQYIGGPAWYEWQAHLPPNSPDRVEKRFSDLLTANALIMDMSQMPLVSPNVMETLKLAKQRGIRILVASARGENMVNATETQFSQDHILKLIESDTIKTPSGHVSFPGAYMPKHGVRPIVYQNGTLFLSGQNKGVMMQDFLQKTKLSNTITHIIFVDDTFKNDQQMAAAFHKNPLINVDCIYYTHLKAHKANFLHGKNAGHLQAIAKKRWERISASLKENLPGNDLSS